MVVFYQILEWLFGVVFILSAILLVIVILLQEGKGGGLADAFGGMGGETFGVRASGIARFTGWVAFVFMASAILAPIASKQIAHEQNPFRDPPKQEAPPGLPPDIVPDPPKDDIPKKDG